jgi:uncharacterized membrane protein YedE/YeeE
MRQRTAEPQASKRVHDQQLQRHHIAWLSASCTNCHPNALRSEPQASGTCKRPTHLRAQPHHLRSFVFTLIFMAAGAAAATLTGTAQALGVAAQKAPLVWAPSDVVVSQGAILLAFAMLSTAAAGALARNAASAQRKVCAGLVAAQVHAGYGQLSLSAMAVVRMCPMRQPSPSLLSALDGSPLPDDWPSHGTPPQVAGLVTELLSGALFSFGLVYSQMVRPSKVAAFLSPTFAGFDASLMFVMGGALAIALPAFQWVKGAASAPPKPLCGDAFTQPPSSSIDTRLVAGGVMFGAGWGISGMCPGPAIVALAATLSPPVVVFVSAMVVGMALDCAATRTLALPAKPAAA